MLEDAEQLILMVVYEVVRPDLLEEMGTDNYEIV